MDETSPIIKEVKEVTIVKGEPVVVSFPSRKVCRDCKVEKDLAEYYKQVGGKDGHQGYCKVCRNRRDKEVLAGDRKRGFRLQSVKTDNQRKLAHLLIDNPKMGVKELAEATGLAPQTIINYLGHTQLLKALRQVGAKEVTRMIPKALHAMNEIFDGANTDVKFKAATKILESEKIIGPNRVEIGILDMQGESTERLRQMIKEAKEFPDQVIQDAEVVE